MCSASPSSHVACSSTRSDWPHWIKSSSTSLMTMCVLIVANHVACRSSKSLSVSRDWVKSRKHAWVTSVRARHTVCQKIHLSLDRLHYAQIQSLLIQTPLLEPLFVYWQVFEHFVTLHSPTFNESRTGRQILNWAELTVTLRSGAKVKVSIRGAFCKPLLGAACR